MPEPLIELDHVSRSFVTDGRAALAVDDVSLRVEAGELLCLVGESGCGKTTTGKLLVGLLRPSAGAVRFKGRNVAGLRGRDWKDYRLGVQLVHQDPFASLNPTQRIRDILLVPLRRHGYGASDEARRRRVLELLEIVDLTPAADVVEKYPHQLSGGQRQRVAIARALTVAPAFIVADEAVSMVDVSIRVSLLDTLRRLRADMGLAVLLITHDLALGRYFAGDGRIGVMYLGRLVELGAASTVVGTPEHPYTRALVAASPLDPRRAATGVRPPLPLRGSEIPNVAARPSGCPFHPRCPLFEPGLCDIVVPELSSLVTGSSAACHPVAREFGATPAVRSSGSRPPMEHRAGVAM